MAAAGFEAMLCPRCRGSLEPSGFDDARGRLEHGSLEWSCATFPIVGGIATIKFDVATEVATAWDREQRYDLALAVLLGQRAAPAGSNHRDPVHSPAR